MKNYFRGSSMEKRLGNTGLAYGISASLEISVEMDTLNSIYINGIIRTEEFLEVVL
jgi:hypothetical protein